MEERRISTDLGLWWVPLSLLDIFCSVQLEFPSNRVVICGRWTIPLSPGAQCFTDDFVVFDPASGRVPFYSRVPGLNYCNEDFSLGYVVKATNCS